MKFGLIAVLSLVSFSAFSSTEFSYSCECQDTGYECDGIEVMKLNVGETSASFQFEDSDGEATGKPTEAKLNETLTASRDSEIFPRTKYFGFDTTSNRNAYPSVFVSAKMMVGSNRGGVQLPELSQGEVNHVWEFVCTRN
ncbi:MAG: hypothetical protein EOP09_05030 [Proteobacteria bacterium]|nr:MAG: hypothetical protein EOP09_05030 [Pseudomonadota bacterium]